jgi:hypothetical protein
MLAPALELEQPMEANSACDDSLSGDDGNVLNSWQVALVESVSLRLCPSINHACTFLSCLTCGIST